MLRKVLVIFVVFCFLLSEGAKQRNGSEIRINRTVGDIDIPDDFLLIIDRLEKNTSLFARSRKPSKQQSLNTTVSSETSSQSNQRRCVCDKGVCKCCTGYLLDLIRQKACMRVTYHPGDFAFDVAMSFNDRILYENSMSGKNPRPICISPPRLDNLKVCAKFYNVFFPGRNFHFCLAMTGQWGTLELFNFAFDCLRMGANGITRVKPYENGGLSIPNPQGGVDAVIDSGEDDIEDYDENVVKNPQGGGDAVTESGEDDIEDYDGDVLNSLIEDLFERR